MMRLVSGEVNEEATWRLRDDLVRAGHFLPCRTHPRQDLVIDRADTSQMTVEAMLSEKIWLSPDVVRLSLEPEIALDWTPGQYINLIHPDGTSRSYSIASIAEEDYFLILHVKRVEGGAISGWVHDELQGGDFLTIQGPMGDCVYRPEDQDRPLIMLATVTGAAPLYGVLRDALRQDHRGEILICHGASTREELYLDKELTLLARSHPNLIYRSCPRGERVTQVAFDPPNRQDATNHVLYVCGNPDMVYEARYRAIGAGIQRADILADPFVSAEPYWPQDNKKLASLNPEPELWEALDQGRKLRKILDDLYTQIYQDPRLSPFFQHATKQRAVSKQYEFLASIFHVDKSYFGLHPFNAHHWMIISDELFDYRENLFEACLRRHGVEEKFIRRWMSIQELFRREMVKSSARGMIIDGVERLKAGYSQEVLAIGSLCDGCHQEMPAGTRGLMHQRTEQLFCLACNPRSAG